MVWWRHDKRHVHGDDLTQGLGAKGTRGAHIEHVSHVSDAGGFEVQRVVEGRCGLPSRRGGQAMHDVRGADREARGPGVATAQAACTK